ncbi:DNA adenine methylase [Ferruginibacter yonginensis]|uniref:DNA adenine methylase n=1 Tax=Ferruginibacter yonginensis TaxID=1310416 RepID=A0ABV8QTY9_9BACT
MSKAKTPITYYGGKQKLVPKILKQIPQHKMYAEPFVGGAAVFFSKPPSHIELINDTNSELINFYKVLQNRYVELEQMVKVTLHSRRLHADARVVYDNPHLFDEIKRAWSVWVLSTQSFCAMLDGSFGYDKNDNTTTKKISNKRNEFSEQYALRMQNVLIECTDALYIIKSRDTEHTFFYCDPPYFNSDMGHYDGYSEQDFENLLIALSEIKGKFLLSCYPSPLLSRYLKAHGWHTKCYEQGVSVNAKGGYTKRKWEMLVANYELVD